MFYVVVFHCTITAGVQKMNYPDDSGLLKMIFSCRTSLLLSDTL